MMRKRREAFSAEELRELWALWKRGHTLREIGEALSRPRDSLHAVIQRTGGFVPRAEAIDSVAQFIGA